MSERWINSKGKIFTGQNASVPAPEDKSPVVVDYEELKQLEIVMTQVGAAPIQARNASPQPVAVSAVLQNDGQLVPSWDYTLTVEDGGGDTLLSFSNIVAISGGIAANAIFAAGVTTGQTGVVRAVSGGKIGRLVITVA